MTNNRNQLRLNLKPQDYRRKELFIAFTLIAIGIIFALVGISGNSTKFTPHVYGLRFEWVAAGLGLWLIVLGYGWYRYTGRFDPFEPPSWISLNVYIQVVLNIWLLQRNELTGIPWVDANREVIMPLTVFLFVVGLTVLWISYEFFYRRMYPARNKLQLKSGNFNLTITSIIWLIGFLFSIYAAVKGIGSYLGISTVAGFSWENYFYFVSLLENAALAGLIIHLVRNQSLSGWLWFGFVVFSELALSLINGSKGFALSLLWIAIYIYYAQQKLPKRWLLAGAVAVIILVPVVNDFRDILRYINLGSGVGISQRIDALGTAITSVNDQSIGGLFTSTTDTFKSRQGSIMDISASVLVLHPNQIPYLGGQMAAWFFPQMIPRLFWPNKPTDRPAILYITSTYTGAPSEYTLSDIGLFADAYRAGGWIIVMICFFVLAFLLAWLYLQGPGNKNIAGTVFYVIMITQIIRYEGDITTTAIRVIQFAPLLWFAIFKIMFNKKTTTPLKTTTSLNERP
jgi:hypothetical protein